MRASWAGWLLALAVVPVFAFATLRADEDAVTSPPDDAAAPEVDPVKAARLAERDRLVSDAQKLLAAGNAPGAEEHAQAALVIEKELLGNGDPELIGTLDLIARCQISEERWDAAQQTRDEIVAISIAAYGEADYRVVDARLALQDVALLRRLTPTERDELSKAEALRLTGSQAFAARQYGEAADIALRVLEVHGRILGKRHHEYARKLNNLAAFYVGLADYTRAEPMLREALGICKEVMGKQHPYYASALNNLAGLYVTQADYARAEPLFREALEIRKSALGVRDPEYATSLNNLALFYYSQGDNARAEPLFREALDIWKEAPDERRPGYAVCLSNLAGLYQSQADYSRAERLFREALGIWKEVVGEQHPNYATTLNNLALVYQSQSDFARAEPLHREVLAIYKEVLGERHPYYAQSLNNLAGLYHGQTDYAQAEPLLREALQIKKESLGGRHPAYAESLNNLAVVLADVQRPNESLVYSLEAAGIVNELLETSAATQSERQQLAMLRASNHYSGNVLAMARLTGIGAGDVYRALLTSKGQVFLRQRALRQLRLAVADDPESPAARTFALLSDRTRELDRLAKFVPGPESIDEHGSQLEELALDVERLQQELAGLNAEFRQSRESAAVTPDELAVSLPTDAVLIDFREYIQYLPHDAEHALGRRELQYAVFITRRGQPVQVVWLGPAAPINAAVLAWREQFGAGRSTDTATELRRLVWEPLEVHLDGVSTVLISPDGGLNAIPFGALPGNEPETYLIEERAFVSVPAPLLLPKIIARDVAQSTDASLLLVGDVDYGSDPGLMELATTERSATAARDADGRWNWDRLPQTRVEVVSIDDTFHRAFGRAPSVSLREAEATEQAFREAAAAARYVHVATHGYFAPKELKSILSSTRAEGTISLFSQQDVSGWHPGLLSGIVFAGANRPPDPTCDDGVLTALEVAEMDLSGVELATLSACETGLGRTAGGEGVLGLQRAFQLAGARTTVASLWKVDDKATQTLMVEFYENLWRKKMSRVEALRQAQLTMLREGVNRGIEREGLDEVNGRLPPYYWAAFVLSGDWR